MQYLRRNYLAVAIGAAAALLAVAIALGVGDMVSDDPEPERRASLGSLQFDLGELRDALEESGDVEDLDDLRRLAELPQFADLLELLRSGAGNGFDGFEGFDGFDGGSLFGLGQPALGVTIDDEGDRLTVDEVLPGTPAANAGLRPGDEIVRVDGDRVDRIDELREAVAGVDAGEVYEIEVRRDGELRTLEVEPRALVAAIGPLLQGLGEALGDRLRQQFGDGGSGREAVPGDRSQREGRPGPQQRPFQPQRPQQPQQPQRPGEGGQRATPAAAPQLGVSAVDASDGVRVAEVLPGSGADLAGLRPGDVIVAVDGAPVHSVEQLRERLATFAPGEAVRVTVLRDGGRAALRVTLSAPPQRVAPAVPPVGTSPTAPQAPQRPGAQRGEVQPGGSQPGGAAGANFPPAVLEQLADLVADRLAARAAAAATDATEAAAAAAEPEASETPGAPLTAVFGRIAAIDGDSIRLTGSLGGVTLALNDQTVRIGFKDAAVGDLVTAVVRDGVVQMLIVVG